MNSMTTRRSDLLDTLTNTHQSRFRRQPIQQNITLDYLTNHPPSIVSSMHATREEHQQRQLNFPHRHIIILAVRWLVVWYDNDTGKLFLQQMLNYTATMRTDQGLLWR